MARDGRGERMGGSGSRKSGERAASPGGARQATSHAVVAEALRQRIALGGFEPGDRLPTERELAATFGVGRNTVLRRCASSPKRGWSRPPWGAPAAPG